MISSCATCQGDTLFRLYDPSGTEVAWNDDGVDCDKCSSLSFTYTQSSLYCALYTLHQGCSGDNDCSGEAHITIESTTSVVSKYSFGLIFGNPSILNMSEGILVNYHYNTPKSESHSLSGPIAHSLISSIWFLLRESSSCVLPRQLGSYFVRDRHSS
jgi:hypothetical protein